MRPVLRVIGGNPAMKSDINAIAVRCGVSKATVSRVFTGKAAVSPAVKQKVLAAARALNYSPQMTATQSCVCIITDSLDARSQFEFYPMLTIRLLHRIVGAGFACNVVGFDGLGRVLRHNTKAAIILASQENTARHEHDLVAMGIPLISINHISTYAQAVCFDHRDEIDQAVCHLHAHGHRRIVMIYDSTANWGAGERRIGYQMATRRLGLEPMPEVCYLDSNLSMTEALVTARKTAATAAIVCGEGLIMETAHALDLLDIRVPEDLSIISFEQPDVSKWLRPPHSTIVRPLEDLAARTIEEAIRLIDQPGRIEEARMVRCSIRQRRSVRDLRDEGT